jgi:hypothetical protein
MASRIGRQFGGVGPDGYRAPIRGFARAADLLISGIILPMSITRSTSVNNDHERGMRG